MITDNLSAHTRNAAGVDHDVEEQAPLTESDKNKNTMDDSSSSFGNNTRSSMWQGKQCTDSQRIKSLSLLLLFSLFASNLFFAFRKDSCEPRSFEVDNEELVTFPTLGTKRWSSNVSNGDALSIHA